MATQPCITSSSTLAMAFTLPLLLCKKIMSPWEIPRADASCVLIVQISTPLTLANDEILSS